MQKQNVKTEKVEKKNEVDVERRGQKEMCLANRCTPVADAEALPEAALMLPGMGGTVHHSMESSLPSSSS